MKKKNIAILLLLPFIISLLGVITVNITFKTFENDISHIEWDYKDIEVFKLADTRYRLNATGINASNLPLAAGNGLVWTVTNADGFSEPHAKIVEENGTFYLVPISEGSVTITCSNEKGNITRRTTAIIYLNSVIVVQTKVQSSQNNIDNQIYYGEYDLQNGQKVGASVELDIMCVPESLSQTLYLSESTSNISLDLTNSAINILGEGPASFTLTGGIAEENTLTSFTYSFEVVDEGVNVYTYDDLLNCTNRSAEGEIVVLRKSFESLQNTYVMNNGSVTMQNGAPILKSNNVELFGHYTGSRVFDFSTEAYAFETTYNRSYIDQWNEFAKSNSDYRPITDKVYAGLHVQKDFYGNGYTLNLHNLTFPYDVIEGVNGETGEVVSLPQLNKSNLFRGPLPFYTLGDPNGMPLITAYGQDNVGMYVEGDHITVNDVNLKNCDFGNSFNNLQYTGTVLEIHGDNVTLANSVLQNGKTVLRAFSSQNATVDNCLLQNAMNFLLVAGCNEYIPVDGTRTFTFTDATGTEVTATLNDYLAASNGVGDSLLTSYLMGDFNSAAAMRAALDSIQDALNTADGLTMGGSMTVNDTLFYRSGISSIALESAFNGPFLYNAAPSLIAELFSMMTEGSKPLVPLTPTQVSGVSAPVEMKITGSTKFYDYKTSEDMDLSGLINENISTIVQSVIDQMGENQQVNITIDDIFPLKSMLYKDAAKNGNIYSANEKSYLNVAVAFYGGGLNLSTVSFEGLENADRLGDEMAVNWVDSYLSMQSSGSGMMALMQDVMQKTVTVVTGFESFRFVCMKGNGYLFNETPNVSELRANNQG